MEAKEVHRICKLRRFVHESVNERPTDWQDAFHSAWQLASEVPIEFTGEEFDAVLSDLLINQDVFLTRHTSEG